jgi:IS4 transposase
MISPESGATYIFDKGYCDYNWWYKLQQEGALFVTRFKRNAGIDIVRQRKIPKDADLSILEDAEVTFRNKHPGGKRINHYHGTSLRRVVVSRPDSKDPLVLATNDFKRSAEEIATLYKKRWEIELFFKWLKQNLKIKKFLGRSENAVKTQIYTALITYMLVQMYRTRNGMKHSLKMCLASLRSGLFQRPEVEQTIAHRRRKRRLEMQSLQGALPI